MDVISMQIANKILRKINRNYNGFYELQTATKGQTDFIISKEYGFGEHTLGVYVDGAMAYEVDSYVEVNATTIRFNHPMDGGELILFRTEVAGTTSYPILNPPYDDAIVKGLIQGNTDSINAVDIKLTDAKSRITTTEEKIASIVAVLDADSDGSILDALTDLKEQWESADSSLTGLITNKLESSSFDVLDQEVKTARGIYASLSEKLEAIVSSIHDYDDAIVKQDITDIKSNITALQASVSEISTLTELYNKLDGRITKIESKSNMNLKDTVTGWDYNIAVSNGVLTAELIKVLTKIIIARVGVGEIHIGDTISFTIDPQYQDGSSALGTTTIAYSTDDISKVNVDSLTGQTTALALGEATIKVTATIGTVEVSGQTIITIVVNKAEKVATAKANLTLGEISAVEGDMVLPIAQDNCSISWVSNQIEYISNIGTVTRPSGLVGNKQVTLTATIDYQGTNDTKEFNVTVLAMPLTDAEKLGLSVPKFDTAMSAISLTNITSDFTLPVTREYANVAWESDDILTLGISTGNATVVRPNFIDGDKTVNLTATLNVNAESEVKKYVATVLKLPQTDLEKLTIAKSNLTLGDISAVTTDLTLPLTQDEATITWSSDTPLVIDDTGVVIQPEIDSGDATVTLTATLVVNAENTTKEFVVTVKEKI